MFATHRPQSLCTRFVHAQFASFDQALEELQAGQKRTHWMWFVFPQIAGLGLSPTAQRYAIGSLKEAKAYLSYLLLGERLRACIVAVNQVTGRTTNEVLAARTTGNFGRV